MPVNKTLLYVICAVILIIIILFWFIPTQMSGNSMVPPILFDMEEMIRCRFEMGICLSMYPNPVPKGKNVTVTFRTQTFYNNVYVCLNRDPNIFVMRCHIVNETCKQDIDNNKNNVVAGYYYAFIEGSVDCETNVMPASAQAKSKEVKLETLY